MKLRADRAGPRRWLRVGEAAVHLGIATATLNKLRSYGRGPAYSKLGRVVVYDVEDLDRYAEERKVTPAAMAAAPAWRSIE
jgi:predicted DNA-binding transcriptional regulator AlpA